MKTADLRAMSHEQLGLTLEETVKHLFRLRCQSAADRLETPSEIRKARKDVARIKTLQTEIAIKSGARPHRKRLTRRKRKQMACKVQSLSANLSNLMATIVETTRKQLLDSLDPQGVQRAAVRQWVETSVASGEEFSLEDAVLALKDIVKTGGVSLSLAGLVSDGILQELFYTEIDGIRRGKPLTSLELSMAPAAPRTDRQMIVPWYRKK